MNPVISEPEQRPQIKPVKDPPFWGICLGHTFTHWYPASFYIMLPFISLEFGFSITQATFLITFMYLVKSFVGLPIGAVTDMVSRKSIMMAISISLAGLPYLFMGMASTYWMFLIWVAIMGIGNELWHPASFSSLSALYPGQRGFTFGVHGMAANLGDLLAPVIIGTLLVSMSWKTVIYWNVFPGLLVAGFILILLRNLNAPGKQKKEGQGASFEEYKLGLVELFKNRSVLFIALASGIRSMAQNGLLTFIPLYLAFELSLSPLWVGIYVTILQAGGMLAAPVAGHFSDKVGARKVIMSGMVMTSIMIVVFVLVQNDWLLIICIGLLGFFLYSLRPVMQAWAMERTSQKMAGTTTSLLFTTQSILSSSSPLIGGLLADQFGMMAAFYFVAAVILLGNIVVAMIPKEVTTASS